ncbi:hypothetical protein [Rubellimicrobium roseum]|uniref:Uncharacterized protein n=1 Tax=Rubellimicrobium roseum TaxID=687525 RepID=A0A5C4NJ20_9RHOB|nr:hypothetical protein [Rubellimicrobium roseum]TNC74102.1 hypothetical protein FHG71_02570 [Rubellimicrobium roseum]
MALGHLVLGVLVGGFASGTLAAAGQPLWRVALAYSLAGSLSVTATALRPRAAGPPDRPLDLPLRSRAEPDGLNR